MYGQNAIVGPVRLGRVGRTGGRRERRRRRGIIEALSGGIARIIVLQNFAEGAGWVYCGRIRLRVERGDND
jgi:hypothetical protein